MALADDGAKRLGAKKFVLLHHGECFRESFHYRIETDGTRTRLAGDDEHTQHPNSIGVQLAGDFDKTDALPAQLDAVKALLLELKLRYPAVEIGAHRQVRGDKTTTCPGRRFPMRALREWAASNLLDQRDDIIREVIESQYRP